MLFASVRNLVSFGSVGSFWKLKISFNHGQGIAPSQKSREMETP